MNFAITLHAAGRPAEAVPILRTVVDRRISIYGPHHGNTLYAKRELARALNATGQILEAVALLKDIIADDSAGAVKAELEVREARKLLEIIQR